MAKDTDKAQPQAGDNAPGPDVMLGLWASWMDRMVAPAQATAGQGKPRWQITTDAPTPDVLAGGVKQLEEGLAKDVALNVDRLAACLEDRPLTPTRKSRFAALAA